MALDSLPLEDPARGRTGTVFLILPCNFFCCVEGEFSPLRNQIGPSLRLGPIWFLSGLNSPSTQQKKLQGRIKNTVPVRPRAGSSSGSESRAIDQDSGEFSFRRKLN